MTFLNSAKKVSGSNLRFAAESNPRGTSGSTFGDRSAAGRRPAGGRPAASRQPASSPFVRDSGSSRLVLQRRINFAARAASCEELSRAESSRCKQAKKQAGKAKKWPAPPLLSPAGGLFHIYITEVRNKSPPPPLTDGGGNSWEILLL